MGGSVATRLVAYAALGRIAPIESCLESGLVGAVSLLAAELSGCGWCLGRAQHAWLKAGRPAEAMMGIKDYNTDLFFTERERAALAFTEAVAKCRGGEPDLDKASAGVRRSFTEREVAELTAVVTAEHWYDPATGQLGPNPMPAPHA
jgi:alkylhydroperoxidase family enzyme